MKKNNQSLTQFRDHLQKQTCKRGWMVTRVTWWCQQYNYTGQGMGCHCTDRVRELTTNFACWWRWNKPFIRQADTGVIGLHRKFSMPIHQADDRLKRCCLGQILSSKTIRKTGLNLHGAATAKTNGKMVRGISPERPCQGEWMMQF